VFAGGNAGTAVFDEQDDGLIVLCKGDVGETSGGSVFLDV